MPWSRGPVDERRRMVELWESGMTPTELAARFGVSRQTIHTFIKRWIDEGPVGLGNRSRRPYRSPTRTSLEVEHALLTLKDRHPHYGPDKLVVMLANQGIVLPAPTARDVLRRHGRVDARRARTPAWSTTLKPVVEVPGSGFGMTTDYKGQFRLGDCSYCYPLTIAEPFSRFVFSVKGMNRNSGSQAITEFERVFREWGVPEWILSDRGAPFCVSQSIGAISQLGRWWVRLGIAHLLTQPGRPQQNGIHERMHRTLKQETTRPVERTLKAQQRRFDAFVAEFNHVRPHQALGQKPPATVVQRYRREFPDRLPEVEYPTSFTVRRVRSNGYIKWRGEQVFIGEVLIGEPVGMVQADDETWRLYFGNRRLADWNDRKQRWVPPTEQ